MPPKKKNASKQPDAAKVSPPKTVTSKRGKEYATSAAAARPRRDSAVVESPAPTKTKTKTSAAAAKANPKKRGRPAKNGPEDEEQEEEAGPPKKRGRPPKNATAKSAQQDDEESTPAQKKPGRPLKTAKTTAAKKSNVPAVPEDEEPPPKKRGRPPKGGETTKIAADDEDAANQLGEELDAAASKSKNKGKGKKDEIEEPDHEGTNFWLMKAEQEDRFETAKDGSQINAKFTIDDLRSKDKPEPWDGVRNPVAAKHMKAMRKGDLAFFYASGGKSGRSPGITGIMEIVSEAEQDPTVYDEGAYGYVEKEADRKKWVMVKVEFRKKLTTPVSLKQLQKFAQPSGVLEDMQLFKQTRLSVSKVNEKQWDFIIANLVEGYDDDVDQPSRDDVSVRVEV